MSLGKFIDDHMIETCVLAAVLTIAPTQYFLRHSGHEPPYLDKLSPRDKAYCLGKAERGGHNIALLGGRDAEYFVALEDCVREVNPGAFRR